jgi:hypothetical protein
MSLSSLRQSKYTGENRCLPCTIVNIALAALASALFTVASTVLGAGTFVVSLLIIYLRGYLVPGTPTLTKRYLPDRVLRWFEKEPAPEPTSEVTTIDPERVLLDAQAVSLCENGTDLCLTDDFHANWREKVHTVREQGNPTEEDLRDVLGAYSDQISFEAYGEAILARADDEGVGQWPSSAALITDVAAADMFKEWAPDWSTMPPAGRARVLASLRIFVETCQKCDEPIRVGQESVESCCRSYDVLLSACKECDAALFEMEWTEGMATPESDEQPAQSSSIET